MPKPGTLHQIGLYAIDRACDWLKKDAYDIRESVLLLKSQGIDSEEWRKMLTKTEIALLEAVEAVRLVRAAYDNLPESKHASHGS